MATQIQAQERTLSIDWTIGVLVGSLGVGRLVDKLDAVSCETVPAKSTVRRVSRSRSINHLEL
jgi:hypothetical protein